MYLTTIPEVPTNSIQASGSYAQIRDSEVSKDYLQPVSRPPEQRNVQGISGPYEGLHGERENAKRKTYDKLETV